MEADTKLSGVELEGEISIKEALLVQARAWKASSNPAETMAAARLEIRTTEELKQLRARQQRKSPARALAAS